MIKLLKPKICRVCKNKFTPVRTIQPCCGFDCNVSYAVALVEKNNRLKALKSRRETKEKLLKYKSRAQYLKETQSVFNQWIRLRDKGLNCVSCDKPMLKKINAGHLRSVGSSPHLRFNEKNCHAQCEHCNSFKSGNIILYTENLIKRYGIDYIESVLNDNEPKHYTIDEIIGIKIDYKNRIKELLKAMSA